MHRNRVHNVAHFALRLAFFAVFSLCLPKPGLAVEIPIPKLKPNFESILPIPASKPQVEQGENNFSVLDFTAALLDFSGPPIPARKPAFIPKKPSVVEKLMKKAREPLPRGPLSKTEIEIYQSIFSVQQEGDIKEANKHLENIDDPRLLGHVLFQRYMHPKAYKASFSELRDWLALYNDHPGADRIYRLAVKRKPAGFSGNLNEPVKARGVIRRHEPTMRAGSRYVPSKSRSEEEIRALNAFNRSIYNLVRDGQLTQAAQKLEREGSILDKVEYDLLRGKIAAGYLYHGKPEKAYEFASQSVQRSALHVPKAGWVAGLVSWNNKNYPEAARYFEVVARSPYASSWTVAAGSYWAARAHMRTGNVKAVSIWLKRGAGHPRTFYGLISTRALGWDFDFNWKVPPFTKDYLEVMQRIPAANRAMALTMAGQSQLAEAELVRIQPKDDEQYKALLAYAGYANLPGLALRLGSAASASKGTFYDAALYPTGAWKPQDGYKIDPALVHAIMRQESRFDPTAKSRSGAKGLMQLMPATARSVADKGSAELDHPETNLELGQRYLENLLNAPSVDGDLLNLLIAYNAGPGNLVKWKKQWSDVRDPLLFIELIPSSETRAYVERVLSNYWIYRMREGADTPTLDALASGQSAIYNTRAL